jgi:putative transposase
LVPDQPPKNERRMSCGEPGAKELARPVRRADRGNGPAATPAPRPGPTQPVDTVLLRRLYVLVFICVETRRIEYVACTSNPDGAWMLQQARNLRMDLDDRGRQPRFLIRDRDAKFTHAFDALFRNADVRVIRTPVRAPNANPHMERWIGSIRRECLDRLLITNRRQLERIVRVYVGHYNAERPHRSLELRAPDPGRPPRKDATPPAIHRRDILGGIIHEYEAIAA